MPAITTLADVATLESTPLDELDLPPNLYEGIQRTALAHPDRIATYGLWTGSAEETPRALTFAQTFEALTQTANLLHRLGVGPNDAVTLMMPIIPETGVLLWASATAGIVNPVNTFLELDYLEAIMRAANTKVVVCADPTIDPVSWPKVAALRSRLPALQVIMVGGDTPAGVLSYDDAIAKERGDALTFTRDIQPDDISAYFHTGGTTGLPKLAKHTHRGHILQSYCLSQFEDRTNAQVSMLGIPLFHVGGALASCLHGLLSGSTTVYLHPNGFREPAVIGHYLRNAERFQATVMGAVPAVWSAVLTLPTEGIDLSHVSHGIVGGSTLSVEVANAVESKLGIPLVEGWGMTEVHCFGTLNPPRGERKIGSIGFRNPYLDIDVVELASDGAIARRCSVDEPGLVVVRGPQVTPGYVDPKHNADAWIPDDAGPWLNTGDLGRRDADGYFWLTGRAKDLIIRGGHNIDPALIEDALYAHPDIALAAAVGQPDPRVGEMPLAFVQMKPGCDFNEDALRAFAAERIQERAALPASIVRLDEMPLTPVGKIFKPALRDRAAERVFASVLDATVGPGVINVSVGSHPVHGAFATLTSDAPSEALTEAVASAMAPYAIRYGLQTSDG